jgi:hypothetical protein
MHKIDQLSELEANELLTLDIIAKVSKRFMVKNF